MLYDLVSLPPPLLFKANNIKIESKSLFLLFSVFILLFLF